MNTAIWSAALFAAALVGVAPAAAFEFDTILVSGRPSGDPLGPELGAGIDWSDARHAVINSAGQVAFRGQVAGATAATDVGIWRWQAGVKELLAREGSQAPGLSAGVTVNAMASAIENYIDESGTVLFRSSLTGAGVTTSNNLAWLSVSSSGTPTPVARVGDSAPGLSPVVYGTSISIRDDGPGITDNGKALFFTSLAGPGVNTGNDRGLWYGTPGNALLLVREGDVAPSFGLSATYGDFGFADTYATGDQVAFVIGVNSGTTNQALLAGTPGSLTAIAKQGDLAVGTAQTFNLMSAPKNNAAGDVAFTNSFDVNTRALYLSNGSGPQLIATDGMPAPGTSEVFKSPSSGFGTPYPMDLTSLGDLAFYAELAASPSVNAASDSGLWVHDNGATRLVVREGDAAPGLSGVNVGSILNWTFNDNEDLVFVSNLVGNVTPGVNDVAMWLATADGTVSKVLQTGELFDVDPSSAIDSRTISQLFLGGVAGGVEGQANEQTLTNGGSLVVRLNFVGGSRGVFVTQVPEPASLALAAVGALSLGTVRRGRQ
ncbi:MAG: DUF7453 family protein [Lacipirellulaceae bacterium]